MEGKGRKGRGQKERIEKRVGKGRGRVASWLLEGWTPLGLRDA